MASASELHHRPASGTAGFYMVDAAGPVRAAYTTECPPHRLVNTWLSSWVVLLRWFVAKRDLSTLGRVPTVIDGFDSPIFCAMDEQAYMGTAIDLRRPERPCLGAPELVASYVSSHDIEVLPIQLGSEERKLFPVDEEAVMGSLLAYYAALGS